MLTYSQFAFVAALITVVLALIAYIWAVAASHRASTAAPTRTKALVGASGDLVDELDDLDEAPAVQQRARSSSGLSAATLAGYGTTLMRTAFAFLTLCLVLRAVATGHGPFVTQYEFATSFAWGILAAYAYFEWRYRARTLSLFVLPIAIIAMVYALSWDKAAEPLVPALQNSVLLTIHIVVAIFAYGAFAVSFATAALTLWTPQKWRHLVPKDEVLDRIGYRAVVIGFPLDTMVLILGAVWAQIAWGTYWSWDPKETASLVTWLIYGGYLHARVARGWTGKRAAWLLILGFASVAFTFAGNAIFGGLHSYANVNR